ncbi:hypothetical protein TBLA_0B03460 [Henningerozyma blattae CBS 6284]|uniref:Uncharacterized protein n=1 Tax=Henningerozyma blattae (strain ATCC 34711 / CBS 6284 / DSM 70876 / NBRC 10599 / NRRL Y-10934 / UCD 77-7) TaxID=1071380 RepID=I2GYI5_HENB6|nr:hypothetical protein TBLA_0B03460 [Tetrapisispora blattae CBS 6284]CCH59187.1 hypothetical protein TBLA_0B03460 [Tetrapisispora blattae CBS 6284]
MTKENDSPIDDFKNLEQPAKDINQSPIEIDKTLNLITPGRNMARFTSLLGNRKNSVLRNSNTNDNSNNIPSQTLNYRSLKPFLSKSTNSPLIISKHSRSIKHPYNSKHIVDKRHDLNQSNDNSIKETKHTLSWLNNFVNKCKDTLNTSKKNDTYWNQYFNKKKHQIKRLEADQMKKFNFEKKMVDNLLNEKDEPILDMQEESEEDSLQELEVSHINENRENVSSMTHADIFNRKNLDGSLEDIKNSLETHIVEGSTDESIEANQNFFSNNKEIDVEEQSQESHQEDHEYAQKSNEKGQYTTEQQYCDEIDESSSESYLELNRDVLYQKLQQSEIEESMEEDDLEEDEIFQEDMEDMDQEEPLQNNNEQQQQTGSAPVLYNNGNILQVEKEENSYEQDENSYDQEENSDEEEDNLYKQEHSYQLETQPLQSQNDDCIIILSDEDSNDEQQQQIEHHAPQQVTYSSDYNEEQEEDDNDNELCMSEEYEHHNYTNIPRDSEEYYEKQEDMKYQDENDNNINSQENKDMLEMRSYIKSNSLPFDNNNDNSNVNNIHNIENVTDSLAYESHANYNDNKAYSPHKLMASTNTGSVASFDISHHNNEENETDYSIIATKSVDNVGLIEASTSKITTTTADITASNTNDFDDFDTANNFSETSGHGDEGTDIEHEISEGRFDSDFSNENMNLPNNLFDYQTIAMNVVDQLSNNAATVDTIHTSDVSSSSEKNSEQNENFNIHPNNCTDLKDNCTAENNISFENCKPDVEIDVEPDCVEELDGNTQEYSINQTDKNTFSNNVSMEYGFEIEEIDISTNKKFEDANNNESILKNSSLPLETEETYNTCNFQPSTCNDKIVDISSSNTSTSDINSEEITSTSLNAKNEFQKEPENITHISHIDVSTNKDSESDDEGFFSLANSSIISETSKLPSIEKKQQPSLLKNLFSSKKSLKPSSNDSNTGNSTFSETTIYHSFNSESDDLQLSNKRKRHILDDLNDDNIKPTKLSKYQVIISDSVYNESSESLAMHDSKIIEQENSYVSPFDQNPFSFSTFSNSLLKNTLKKLEEEKPKPPYVSPFIENPFESKDADQDILKMTLAALKSHNEDVFKDSNNVQEPNNESIAISNSKAAPTCINQTNELSTTKDTASRNSRTFVEESFPLEHSIQKSSTETIQVKSSFEQKLESEQSIDQIDILTNGNSPEEDTKLGESFTTAIDLSIVDNKAPLLENKEIISPSTELKEEIEITSFDARPISTTKTDKIGKASKDSTTDDEESITTGAYTSALEQTDTKNDISNINITKVLPTVDKEISSEDFQEALSNQQLQTEMYTASSLENSNTNIEPNDELAAAESTQTNIYEIPNLEEENISLNTPNPISDILITQRALSNSNIIQKSQNEITGNNTMLNNQSAYFEANTEFSDNSNLSKSKNEPHTANDTADLLENSNQQTTNQISPLDNRKPDIIAMRKNTSGINDSQGINFSKSEVFHTIEDVDPEDNLVSWTNSDDIKELSSSKKSNIPRIEDTDASLSKKSESESSFINDVPVLNLDFNSPDLNKPSSSTLKKEETTNDSPVNTFDIPSSNTNIKTEIEVIDIESSDSEAQQESDKDIRTRSIKRITYEAADKAKQLLSAIPKFVKKIDGMDEINDEKQNDNDINISYTSEHVTNGGSNITNATDSGEIHKRSALLNHGSNIHTADKEIINHQAEEGASIYHEASDTLQGNSEHTNTDVPIGEQSESVYKFKNDESSSSHDVTVFTSFDNKYSGATVNTNDNNAEGTSENMVPHLKRSDSNITSDILLKEELTPSLRNKTKYKLNVDGVDKSVYFDADRSHLSNAQLDAASSTKENSIIIDVPNENIDRTVYHDSNEEAGLNTRSNGNTPIENNKSMNETIYNDAMDFNKSSNIDNYKEELHHANNDNILSSETFRDPTGPSLNDKTPSVSAATKMAPLNANEVQHILNDVSRLRELSNQVQSGEIDGIFNKPSLNYKNSQLEDETTKSELNENDDTNIEAPLRIVSDTNLEVTLHEIPENSINASLVNNNNNTNKYTSSKIDEDKEISIVKRVTAIDQIFDDSNRVSSEQEEGDASIHKYESENDFNGVQLIESTHLENSEKECMKKEGEYEKNFDYNHNIIGQNNVAPINERDSTLQEMDIHINEGVTLVPENNIPVKDETNRDTLVIEKDTPVIEEELSDKKRDNSVVDDAIIAKERRDSTLEEDIQVKENIILVQEDLTKSQIVSIENKETSDDLAAPANEQSISSIKSTPKSTPVPSPRKSSRNSSKLVEKEDEEEEESRPKRNLRSVKKARRSQKPKKKTVKRKITEVDSASSSAASTPKKARNTTKKSKAATTGSKRSMRLRKRK